MLLFACVLALVPTPPVPDQPLRTHAVPRLICETEALRAGTTGFIGITFQIEPHWHVYWKGQNDTGGTINFTLKTPDGIVPEGAQWPTPVRQILPGETLNHIYENELTLVIPVRVPAGAAGTTARFSATLDWIACEEACVVEKAAVSLTVPVVAGEQSVKAGVDGVLFDRARARTAKPLAGTPGIAIELAGSKAIVRVSGAAELIFYPGPNCSPMPFLLTEGASKGDSLALTLEPAVANVPRFEGVLEILRGPDRSATYYLVDVSGSSEAGSRK